MDSLGRRLGDDGDDGEVASSMAILRNSFMVVILSSPRRIRCLVCASYLTGTGDVNEENKERGKVEASRED